MTDNIVDIIDSDNLLRRVPFLDPNYIREDGSITSLAFTLKRGEDGISVDVEKLTSYEKSILDKKRFRLYYLIAKIPREHSLECIHNPENNNYAHALIIGNITKPISRKLAAAAVRIKYSE